MITTLAALALSLGSQTRIAPRPNGQALTDYLAKHPWDVSTRGPMLVVDPGLVWSSSVDGGLRSFDRKEFALGSLSVIAPTEMVYIDASLKEPPNLYDGLPRTDKVFYLMSVLDADQWKIACTSGVGLADLRQDQKAVLRSILPSQFTYDNELVGKGNSLLPNPNSPAKATLSPEEEQGVRLHFFQDVELGVKLQNGGFSAVSAQLGDRHLVGKPYLRRSDNAVEDQTTLYGVQIRKVLDNRLKPSDLNYKSKALDVPVPLVKTATIGEACHAVGAACGLKLVADVRISGLTVAGYGESARAGDILQAIALSVTGTFRKVGETYVLTSDLEGIGVKRLRIDAWKSDLEGQTRRRVQEWKRTIGGKGGSRSIAMRTGGALPINDAMAKFMSDYHEDDGSKTLPASQLPPEWQAVLNSGTSHFANTQLRTDVAFPYGEVFWNFVLPDGRPLEWEESLGHVQELTHDRGPAPDYLSKSEFRTIELRSGSSAAALFKTDDLSVAAKLPELAASHGFEEVWIQTWSGECLKEVLKKASALHLRARLVLKPWEVPHGKRTSKPDRNILGQTSVQAENLFENSFDWVESSPIWGRPPIGPGTLMAPDDPSRDAIWHQLIELSKTDGLSGVVLCDTEPRGYEPKNTIYYFHVSGHFLDLGYTAPQREQFLTENQVDPVDIVDRRILNYDKLDLSLPFFGDPRNVAVDQPSGSLGKWNRFRAEINKRAIQELTSRMTPPILAQPRQQFRDTLTLDGVQVLPWDSRSEFPEITHQESLQEEADNVPDNGFCLWQFGHPVDPAIRPRMRDNILRHMKDAKGMLAFDFSSVSEKEVQEVLDQWFRKG